MGVGAKTQAVLLLTGHFGRPDRSAPKPLTATEWGRVAQWLHEHGVGPERLLEDDPKTVMPDWVDRTVSLERLRYLLGRGTALGLALEKWERAGLWVMTRADPDYPTRLKKRLAWSSPPVLFGAGQRTLVDGGGLAIVGSREASEADLEFARALGARAADQRIQVVSGGARGIDEAAMLGALAEGGNVVGVLADSLLRAATSARYRQALMAKQLALVSPFHPEAGFQRGNAMARNREIYCLADGAVVVHAKREGGGTWSGATEDLKRGWVPLWTKSSAGADSGAAALVAKGARWLPEPPIDVCALLEPTPATARAQPASGAGEEPSLPFVSEPAPSYEEAPARGASAAVVAPLDDLSLYELFLHHLARLTAGGPASIEAVRKAVAVERSQAQKWLARGVKDGCVQKTKKRSTVLYRADVTTNGHPGVEVSGQARLFAPDAEQPLKEPRRKKP